MIETRRLTPSEIEDRAAKADEPIMHLCSIASVSRRTWYRWRALNCIPQSKARAYYRLIARLEDAEQEHALAAGREAAQ